MAISVKAQDAGRHGRRRAALPARSGCSRCPAPCSPFRAGSNPGSPARGKRRRGLVAVDDASIAAHLAPSISVRSHGQGAHVPLHAGGNDEPARSFGHCRRARRIARRARACRGARPEAAPAALPGWRPLQIAPTAFNLGVSRGYNNFAHDLSRRRISARSTCRTFRISSRRRRPTAMPRASLRASSSTKRRPPAARRARSRARRGDGRRRRRLPRDAQSRCHGRRALFAGARPACAR